MVIDDNGIADERGFYYQATGLATVLESGGRVQHDWFHLGEVMREHPGVYIRCVIGMTGYAAGPGAYFIDPYVLADGFMSRFPARSNCRVGHFERAFPAGYLDALVGIGPLKDPQLNQAYLRYKNVVSGDLASISRISDAWFLANFNKTKAVVPSFEKNAVNLPGLPLPPSSNRTCLGSPFSGAKLWRVEVDPLKHHAVVRPVFVQGLTDAN